MLPKAPTAKPTHRLTLLLPLALLLAACGGGGSNFAACGAPQIIDGNPAGDTTWADVYENPDCVDYRVADAISYNDEKLEIAPGVRLAFEEGMRLVVRGEGVLIADGTEGKPIVFTGTQQERGHWFGILLSNSDQPEDNVLDHVTVEYGGGSGDSDAANVRLGSAAFGASSQITNSTLRESGGYGFYQDIETNLGAFGGNTITGNALAPVHGHTNTAHMYEDSSSYGGNDLDYVELEPNRIADDADVRWQDLGVPYRVLEDNPPGFSVYGKLALDPGVTVAFEEGLSMAVREGGVLSAMGTSAAPIVLTATDPTPGHWRGLLFRDTPSAENLLEHVIIEYGGGGDREANLVVTQSNDTSQLTLQNLTLRHGARYGLFARFDTTLTDGGSNTYSGNASGPAYVFPSIAGSLSVGSSYTGNGNDYVTMQADETLTQSHSWQDLGVPYRLVREGTSHTLVVDGATLTLEPGVVVQFEHDVGLSLNWDDDRGPSLLSALGEEDNRITLTGADGVKWKGLNAEDSNIVFDYVTITDGGSSGYGGTVGAPSGNVTLKNFLSSRPGAFLDVRDQVIQSGGGNGLVFDTGKTTSSGCKTFEPLHIPGSDTRAEHCI